MSGTRHHVVPKFLLRGFASHAAGDETYAWVYRIGRPPFNTNISNIAVEGHFYTHENRPDVDDLITDAEGPLANTVEELRVCRSAASVPAKSLATLIAHLEARTRHLRTNFEDIATTIFTRTIDFIQDQEAFKRFLVLRFERDPETLLGPLREEIRNRGLPTGSTDLLLSLLRPHLQTFVEPMLPKLTAEFSAAMSRIKTERPDMLRAAARNGQLRALEQAVAPEIKVAQYERLNYVVLKPSEAMPLGDSAVIFEIEADRKFTTFLSADDRLVAAYMPLTTDLVLCGYAGTTTPPTRDLPVAVARCSRDFFVAHADSDWFQSLHPLISQLSVIIDQVEIERLLHEAFEP